MPKANDNDGGKNDIVAQELPGVTYLQHRALASLSPLPLAPRLSPSGIHVFPQLTLSNIDPRLGRFGASRNLPCANGCD